MPTVFPRPMSTNANEAFRQGLKKEKIKREIMANEITLAREQEIEKEVRMKMMLEKALETLMQRPKDILVPQGMSNSFNITLPHLVCHNYSYPIKLIGN